MNLFMKPLPKNLVVRNMCHRELRGGVPGENLPFGKSLGRPGKMTLIFCLFLGSGMWLPNIAVLYMLIRP